MSNYLQKKLLKSWKLKCNQKKNKDKQTNKNSFNPTIFQELQQNPRLPQSYVTQWLQQKFSKLEIAPLILTDCIIFYSAH